MSTLAVYSGDPIATVERYGEIINKSGLFGCKSSDQGKALVLMAMSENLSITEMRRRYHIIQSDLSMRADYMQAEFRRLGGTYRWINQGDDGQKAVIRVKFAENDMEVQFTIEEARQQGLVKPKSNWDKNPGSMLRARVITKAIRMVCPEVLCGFPADNEMDDDTVVDAQYEVSQVSDAPGQTAQSVEPSPVQPEVTTEGDTEPVTVDALDANKADGQQIHRITMLFKELGVPPDAQLVAIQKRGAKDMGDLSSDGAKDLLEALEEFLVKQTNEMVGESKSDPAAMQTTVDGPVDEPTLARIRERLGEASQWEGVGNLGERIKAKLAKHGLAKLADLSAGDAEILEQAISQRNLANFFDASLQGHRAAKETEGNAESQPA